MLNFTRNDADNKDAMSIKKPIFARGQAVLEYVLLLLVVVGTMSFMFGYLRNKIFKLWICDITPRIVVASGCGSSELCLQNMSDQNFKDQLSGNCE